MEKLKRILNDDELSVGDPNDRKITPEMQAAKLLESVAKSLRNANSVRAND
jgi:hypothetical protein